MANLSGSERSTNQLITNIGDLVTLAPLVSESKFSEIRPEDLGRLQNAWLKLENGKIQSYGTGAPPKADADTIDAKGGLVMPGLIDSHTHPVFAGDRSHEFCRRLSGATYQEIAQEGGGIGYTVRETQKASEEDLLSSTLKRLDRIASYGVTTAEVKSGYGQTVADEIKLLNVLNRCQEKSSINLEITCLGLHACPKGQDKEVFITDMTEKLLPIVAEKKLAKWVDGFVENGYFSVEESNGYFEKAMELGLKIRVHADEFVDSNAALTASGEWGAASADHLECTPKEALKVMAENGTVATLLPGTSLYTGIPYTDAKPFLANKVPIAVATDYNPGSCILDNIGLAVTLAALHCGLDLPTAVASVTWVAAYSLRLHDRKGAIAKGFDGDLVIYEHDAVEKWLADLGRIPPHTILRSKNI